MIWLLYFPSNEQEQREMWVKASLDFKFNTFWSGRAKPGLADIGIH